MVTESYGSNRYQKAIMEPNKDLMIGFPYRVYLNFISTGGDQQPSDFKIQVAYIKYDPNDNSTVSGNDNVIVI